MPILSRGQIKEIAKGIVNMMVSDVLFEFPVVNKAILKVKAETWAKAIDDLELTVEDVLLNRFGCSD